MGVMEAHCTKPPKPTKTYRGISSLGSAAENNSTLLCCQEMYGFKRLDAVKNLSSFIWKRRCNCNYREELSMFHYFQISGIPLRPIYQAWHLYRQLSEAHGHECSRPCQGTPQAKRSLSDWFQGICQALAVLPWVISQVTGTKTTPSWNWVCYAALLTHAQAVGKHQLPGCTKFERKQRLQSIL